MRGDARPKMAGSLARRNARRKTCFICDVSGQMPFLMDEHFSVAGVGSEFAGCS
jgi:hypothetical protein